PQGRSPGGGRQGVTASDVLAVLATFAGLAMAVSPGLQIRRMRRTRSSHDISLQYLGLLCLGFVLWIAYGASIANWVIVGTNCASLSVMLVTILVALGYRRGGSRRAAAALAAQPGTSPGAGEVATEAGKAS
ncbi:MAG TPA: SemiSWEET family transporter, partial [Candidatus Limnocylindrales bacterium]